MGKWKPLFVIAAGLLAWGLSELFPPWEYLDGNTSAVRSAGYHFYNSPPALKSPEDMKKLFDRENRDFPPLSIHVQPYRLQAIAQRMVLLWLTANGFILSFGRGSSLTRVLLWMSFCFAGAVALALVWRVLR